MILSLTLKAVLTGCKHSNPQISSANNAGSKNTVRFPISSLFKIHVAQHSGRPVGKWRQGETEYISSGKWQSTVEYQAVTEGMMQGRYG